MVLKPEVRSTVFGDSKENLLPSNDSDRMVQVREYQMLLLQKAVHENVRLTELVTASNLIPKLCVFVSVHAAPVATKHVTGTA